MRGVRRVVLLNTRSYGDAAAPSFPQYLLNVPETRISKTSNGIRVATQQVCMPLLCCGRVAVSGFSVFGSHAPGPRAMGENTGCAGGLSCGCCTLRRELVSDAR